MIDYRFLLTFSLLAPFVSPFTASSKDTRTVETILSLRQAVPAAAAGAPGILLQVGQEYSLAPEQGEIVLFGLAVKHPCVQPILEYLGRLGAEHLQIRVQIVQDLAVSHPAPPRNVTASELYHVMA